MENKIGAVPEFVTDETTPVAKPEEVVETTPEVPQEPVGETETPADPLPANEPPVSVPDETEKQIQGLLSEKTKLLEEIKSLRGSKRELKQQEITAVTKQLDALDDLNPTDVSVVERILRSKGYITKDEAQRMSYEAVKNEELERFLEKYPEYKPENDPNDIHWSALQREMQLYRQPENPKLVGSLLERAHRGIAQSTPTPRVAVRKQQIATASHGAGGTQRPAVSSTKRALTDAQRASLLQGGWNEEDIKRIES